MQDFMTASGTWKRDGNRILLTEDDDTGGWKLLGIPDAIVMSLKFQIQDSTLAPEVSLAPGTAILWSFRKRTGE